MTLEGLGFSQNSPHFAALCKCLKKGKPKINDLAVAGPTRKKEQKITEGEKGICCEGLGNVIDAKYWGIDVAVLIALERDWNIGNVSQLRAKSSRAEEETEVQIM